MKCETYFVNFQPIGLTTTSISEVRKCHIPMHFQDEDFMFFRHSNKVWRNNLCLWTAALELQTGTINMMLAAIKVH